MASTFYFLHRTNKPLTRDLELLSDSSNHDRVASQATPRRALFPSPESYEDPGASAAYCFVFCDIGSGGSGHLTIKAKSSIKKRPRINAMDCRCLQTAFRGTFLCCQG